MVSPRVMFTLVISQIFLPRVPNYLVHLLCDLVTNPEKSHFHRTGSLPLYGVVCDADGRGIVAVHGCFRLRMPHILEDVAKNNRRLAIVVECAEFGFCRGGHDGVDNLRYVEDGAVVFWDFFVAGHEHVASGTAARVRLRQVGGIAVDREAQKQYRLYWRPGTQNLADYFTKQHPASHHKTFRSQILTSPSDPEYTKILTHKATSTKSLVTKLLATPRFQATNNPRTYAAACA